MSETNNSGDKSLGVPAPKATLHLKRPVDTGTVRQSFSHGRSKVVVVEKKRRVIGPGEAPPRETSPAAAAAAVFAPKPAVAAQPQVAPRGPTVAPARPTAPTPPKTGVVLPTLTE